MKKKLPASRRARVALFGVLGLLALYLLYVGSVFLIFQLNLPERWTRDAPRVRLTSQSGYSLWPGRLHLTNTEIVIQDYNITMQLRAKRADLDVGLLSIFSGTVHIEEAIVRGGKVWLRHRVHDESQNRRRIEAFPHISGFERPVEYPKGPRQYGKQRPVIIDHIDAEADELWFVEYRATGRFRAEGGFRLEKDVIVDPSWMKTENAVVRALGNELLRIEEWNLKMNMGPFPRRKAKLQEVFGSLTAELSTKADLVNLETLAVYLQQTPLSIGGGHARLEGRANIDKGKIQKGKLTLSDAETQLRWGRLPVSLGWELDLSGEAPGRVATELRIERVGAENGLSLSKATGKIVWNQPRDLTTWELGSAQMVLQDLRSEDPNLLRRAFPSKQPPALVVHRANGQFEYGGQPSKLTADGQLEASWFVSADEALGLDGDFRVDCDLSSSEKTTDITECQRVSLEAHPLVVRRGKKEAKLPLSLTARELSSSEGFSRIDSTWSIRGANPQPFALEILGKNFLAKLGVVALPLDDWQANVHLNRDGTTWAGQLERTQVGSVSAVGRFVADQSFISAWEMKTPVGRYGIVQEAGGTKVRPFVTADWFESCPARLGEKC